MSSRGGEFNEDVDALGSLFASCSSITDRALAYRTLSSSTEAITTTADDIVTEKELASWLDRRILDFKACLEQPSSKSSSNQQVKSLQRAIQQRQHELLDESFRQQQELLLLKRIIQSKTAKASIEHEHFEDEMSSRRVGLLCEGQHIRNRKVKLALESSRKLDQVREKLLEAAAESHRLQKENQVLWKKLQEQQVDMQTENSGESSTTTHSHLDRENIALRRILADLLAGSGLDWTEDARLGEIMSRVFDE